MTPFADDPIATWGLRAVEAIRDLPSEWTGRGVRVAMLDTGVDRAHPDLAARVVAARSFVAGCPVDDEIGHGTHCAGTAVGFKTSAGCRYGIAYGADLYVARVLDRTARAEIATVIAGIDWALSHDCQVIALPIGIIDPVPSPEFDAAGRRALDADCLMIAAAGPYWTTSVSRPADADGIMAVGAVDHWLNPMACPPPTADAGTRGQVDIVAPGARIHSAAPGAKYATQNGTSMATAHVAGVAALWSEAESLRGRALWGRLIGSAQRLRGSADAAGYGLVTAP
jgi:subtilisin family serine protease